MAITEQRKRELDALMAQRQNNTQNAPQGTSTLSPERKKELDIIGQRILEQRKDASGKKGMEGFAVGAGKGAGSTLVGSSELGEKMITGLGRIITPKKYEKALGFEKPTVSSVEKLAPNIKENLKPRGTAEKIGFGAEQIGEFFIPGGASLKAGRFAEMIAKARGSGKILEKGASLGARSLTEAGVVGGQTALQRGGIDKETLEVGALGAAFPVAGAALSTVFKPVARGAGEKLINSLIKPLTKNLSYGKNPSRGLLRRVGSFNSFEDGLQKTNKAIGEVVEEQKQILSHPLLSKEKLSIRKEIENTYNDAMKEADKLNNNSLYNRLKEDRDAILYNIERDLEGNKIFKPRELDLMSPQEMADLKILTGKLRKWTGNPSEDKIAERTIGKVYGKMKEKLNKLSDDYSLNLKQVNEDLSDLITANKVLEYREKILARQNILNLPVKGALYGIGSIVAGGFSPLAFAGGLTALGLDKALSSPAVKTRIASTLSKIGQKERSEMLKTTPILGTLFNRIFGENLGQKMDEKKILNKINEYLKGQNKQILLPHGKTKTPTLGTIYTPPPGRTTFEPQAKSINYNEKINKPTLPPKKIKTLYHGSTGGSLRVDKFGNINLSTDKDLKRFSGDVLKINTLKLNIEDVGKKENLFKIVSNPKEKQKFIDKGIDVLSAENHQIAIDPPSFSKKTSLPLRESLKNKTIQDLMRESKMYGGIAGIEPEYDEQGKIKGIGFSPEKAAIGIGLLMGGEKAKLFSKYKNKILSPIDKKLRIEINDKLVKFISPNIFAERAIIGNGVKLKYLLKHDELFANYPSIENMNIKTIKNLTKDTKIGGFYDPEKDLIVLDKDWLASGNEKAKSIILHEIQHKIQAIEDFATGGNDQMLQYPSIQKIVLEKMRANVINKFGSKIDKKDIFYLNKLIKKTEKGESLNKKELDEIFGSIDIFKRKGKQVYQNLAGEIEARKVQERMNLESYQRRDKPFYDDDFKNSYTIFEKDIK